MDTDNVVPSSDGTGTDPAPQGASDFSTDPALNAITTFPDCTSTCSLALQTAHHPPPCLPSRKKSRFQWQSNGSRQHLMVGLHCLQARSERRVKKRPPLAQLQFPDPNTLDENTIRLQSVDWLSYHQHDYHSRRLWCPLTAAIGAWMVLMESAATCNQTAIQTCTTVFSNKC
jgi:hypothetical protein